MAAEISVGSFLDLLRQSGLVSDNQMLSLMAEFSGEGAKPQTAREVADELVKREILTEWQADNLMLGKHRGFFLGPHRILRQLGQGGMSKVFLAEHEMMRRRCAIKILPSKHQGDPELLSRFRLEARAIAALDHPHIVRAYDFNKDVKYGKDIDYLVMEYVEGQDLRRMVEKQGPLDYRKAADYICQAAEGLAHAHAAGLVHRDVKPANLLVDPNGVLKILDLGLARVTFEGDEAWQNAEGEQSAVGTADYVAPEQVMDSRNADGRADIYSLGYTFYFLLTGRRPFPKATLPELLMAHRVENPEPITKLRPDVPLELVEIIDQMTAKTPELRFQTATEVAEKLQAWLHDSASGREYSRISALMAAAMRTKQPGPEDALPNPESAKAAELELAALDDDVTATPRASSPGSHRAEPPKSTESRERPRKPGPGDSGKTAALSKTRANLLLDLIPDQAGPSPVTLPQLKYHSGVSNLLTSPWFWIGLAGVVFVVLVLLAVLLSSSPQQPPRQPAHRPTGNKSEAPVETPPSPNQGEPTPQAPSLPSEPHKLPESSVSTPPPDHSIERPAAPPPVEKPSSSPEPPPAKPKEQPETAPQQNNPPTEKKTTDAEKAKLLAGLTTIAFKFTSSSGESNSPLNILIARQASDKAKSVGLKLDEKSPNVMSIEVKTSSESDPITVLISAELTCGDAKGGPVCAWNQSKELTCPRRSRPDQALKVLRPAVTKFFEQFARDVQRARSEVKQQ